MTLFMLNTVCNVAFLGCFVVLLIHKEIQLKPELKIVLTIAIACLGWVVLTGEYTASRAEAVAQFIIACLNVMITRRIYKREVLKQYTRRGDRQ